MALHEDSVFQNKENTIEVLNFDGEVKQVITLTEQDGEVTHIDIRNKHMVVATSNNVIRIWDISRRNLKQVGMPRKFEKNNKILGSIKSVSINDDGKKVCVLADQTPLPSIKIPDTKFYIYDTEMDIIHDCPVSEDRIPVECFWDQNDSRLLAVETEFMKDQSKEDKKNEGEDDDEEVEEYTGKTCETYFVTGDYGVKRQDTLKF